MGDDICEKINTGILMKLDDYALIT